MRIGALLRLAVLAAVLGSVQSAFAQSDSVVAVDTIRAPQMVGEDTGNPWWFRGGALGAVALITLAGVGFWWWRRRSGMVDTRDYIPQPPVPEFAARQRSTESSASSTVPSRPFPGDVEDWAPQPEPEPSAHPTSLEEIPLAPGVTRTVPERAATVFAEWCRRGGPMVGRVELFGAALAAAVPEASVAPVFRDLNAQAEPVRFDAAGGASPAEYWLIRTPAARLLVPHPQSAGQFRDVRGVFDGADLMPSQLSSVEPARVLEEGGGYVLSKGGHLRAQTSDT